MRVRPIVVLAVLFSFLVSCGGLPSEVIDEFGIDRGTNGITSCATEPEPTVFTVFGGRVTGDDAVEIRGVRALDASFDPVDVYVVSTPATDSIGFGSASLATIGDGPPALATAWDQRQRPPASTEPGSHVAVLVVVPPPSGTDDVSFVHDFEITVAVGGDERTFEWTSLQMVGSDEACDAQEVRLSESD